MDTHILLLCKGSRALSQAGKNEYLVNYRYRPLNEGEKSMSHKRQVWLIPMILIMLSLASCNLPGLGSPPTPFPTSQGEVPSAAHTAAAETIIAQLTQVSIPASATPTFISGLTEAAITPERTGTEVAGSIETPAMTLAPTQVLVETPTPEVTHTTEPSPTPTQVQATFAPGDPRASLGEPSWQDTFENGNNWYLYNDENANFEVQDSTLVMTSYRTGSRNAWMLTQNQPLNYHLEIPFTTGECVGLDRYGVIVRSEDAAKGYLFAISCDGRYSFRSWNGQRANKLVEWTESSQIHEGSDQTNRLGIRVEGSKFSLYANGVLLTEVNDSSYPEGGFGVLIGADTTRDLTVKVSDVTYWELP
jgi:hypothetical protein